MSELRMSYCNYDSLKISFSKITQITGRNEKIKIKIYNDIVAYFGSKRRFSATEYDIYLDDNIISPNYFESISLLDETAINNEIDYSKDSLILQYVLSNCESINNARIIDRLNDSLLALSNSIEENINEEINLKSILYFDELIFSNLIKKNLLNEPENIETLSNLKKIRVVLKLLEKILERDPKPFIVSFWNIDNILPRNEIPEFFELLEKMIYRFDIYFLVFSRGNGFVQSKLSLEIEYINIVNSQIFSYPNITDFADFILRNYPSDKVISKQKIHEFIDWSSTDVLDINHKYSLSEKDVIIKLLNTNYSVMCKTSEEKPLNKLEMAYLMSNK